jgi:methyltransferase (TIGR00027 family)
MSTDSRISAVPSSRSLAQAYVLATHQLETPPVFVDPISTRITPLRTDLVAGQRSRDGGSDADRRLHVALCHRFADDVVLEAMASGTTQLVVLHAGLDTTCHRRPYPAMRLYEIDNPEAQTWKRQRLAGAGVAHPEQLTYVACADSFDPGRTGLAYAGYDYTRSTLAIWLDSTVFLPEGAFADTLSWLDRHRGPIEIVFDYLQPPESGPARICRAVAPLREWMARIGHPLVSFFSPQRLRGDFRDRGFDRVQDLCWHDLLTRYVPDQAQRTDPLGGHILRARRPAL